MILIWVIQLVKLPVYTKGVIVMTLSNEELKRRGKAAFKANFWPCVVVTFIMSLFTTLGTASAGKMEWVNGEFVRTPPSGASNLIHFLIGLLITAVIGIGVARFYLNNRERRAQFSDLLCGFREGYANIVLVRLIVRIKIILWSILFIIPGIIKSFSWAMVPYLLSDDPTMDHKTATQRSAEMMQGNKMKLFMLDLSFIGWFILGIITLGIGLVLWAAPYHDATIAEWYAELSGKNDVQSYPGSDVQPYMGSDSSYYM